MAMQLGHVHIKTRGSAEGRKVLHRQFWRDHEAGNARPRLPARLYGVQLNVTTIIADQNHEQHVGIEHIAIETNDYAGALAIFKNGAQRLPPITSQARNLVFVPG